MGPVAKLGSSRSPSRVERRHVEEGFEEPILDLERRIEALQGVGDDVDTEEQREKLQEQLESLRNRVFASLRRCWAWNMANPPNLPFRLARLKCRSRNSNASSWKYRYGLREKKRAIGGHFGAACILI